MTAKDYFARARKASYQIAAIKTHIEALQDLAYGTGNCLSGEIHGSSVKSRTESYAIELVDRIDQLEGKVSGLMEIVCECSDIITEINNPAYVRVLTYRYINALSWEKICIKMNYSKAQINRIHGEALLYAEKILLEKEKMRQNETK